MGEHSTKRQVVIYLPYDLHKELKKLAAERDTTISDLVERAARLAYPAFVEDGMIAAEASPVYGRQREEERIETKKTKKRDFRYRK